MTKSIIRSFSAGELSSEFHASIEIEKHQSGLAECTNMIVSPLGGVMNRPGTQFVDLTYAPTELLSRLIPFEFNKEQVYMLEFALDMRVIKDGEYVLQDLVNAGVFKWTLSGSGTAEYYLEANAGGDPGILEPDFVKENGINMISGSVGNLSPFRWDWGDNDALGFDTIYVRLLDSTDPDTKAKGWIQVNVLVELPYNNESDLAELTTTSSADTLYVFHGDYNRHKITRSAEDTWTVTEINNIDGPYKGRVAGDEDVRINVKFVSGTTWDLTADTAIFDDVEAGEPIRLGFPVPGDLTALYWGWYLVASITGDGIHIRVTQQEDIRPVYQQVLNPFFKAGTDFWEDHSTPKVPPFASNLSYSFANKSAVLTDGAAGDAKMEQAIVTFANIKQRLLVNVSAVSGASPGVIIKIGTASGLGDILTTAPISVPTLVVTTFLPTQEIVFINFDTVGSTDGDTIEIDRVEVFSVGDEPTGGTEYNTTDWRLAAWNSTHGYPQHGIINEQRLISASNHAEPQTIWPSETGNFESHAFNTPTRSTDAFSFFPPTPQINGINGLVLQNGLNVTTAGEMWKVFAASGGVITPTDVNIKIDSVIGSLGLNPITIGNSIMITPRGFEAVTELTSSLELSGYAPRDLSILASHLFENRRIIRWAYARNPDSIIWCVLDNGELLGITYNKEYDIWAWHKHSTPLGEGFKDVAVIPNSLDDNADDVYFIVNRADIGETPSYIIEMLNKRINPQDVAFGQDPVGTPYDYRFLDSAITSVLQKRDITGATNANPVVITSTDHGYINGNEIRMQNFIGMVELNNQVYKVANKTANTYELTNPDDDTDIDGTGFGTYLEGGESRVMIINIGTMDHLEGKTVTALADGAVEHNLLVSSGTVTLSQRASFIHVGIPYVSEIETLDLDIISDRGSTQGRKKGVTGAHIYFKDSRNAEISTKNRSAQWWKIKFKDEAHGEEPPALVTKVKEQSAPSNYDFQERLKIRQVDPLPITIKRIIPDVDYGD